MANTDFLLDGNSSVFSVSHHFHDINVSNVGLWIFRSWSPISMYNIHIDTIRWQIPTSIKVIIPLVFMLTHHFRDIKVWNVWPWMIRSRSWSTTFAVVPFNGKYLTSYLMAIVMLAFLQCLSKEPLEKCDLEIQVKVMKSNICKGSVWWQISTSIKVVLEHFSLALTVFEILTFQNLWPWKCRSRSGRTTFKVIRFNGKYATFYLLAIVTFALSLTIYEIFANREKCKNIDLKNEGQVHGVEKRNLRQSIRNVLIHIGDFSPEF